ncbi:MAG: DUF5305 domain-containing protein [Oscillospiraceae bacterium]|nr:DUF5305 domain-containing protein [Oscillospiraceae bacterium]
MVDFKLRKKNKIELISDYAEKHVLLLVPGVLAVLAATLYYEIANGVLSMRRKYSYGKPMGRTRGGGGAQSGNFTPAPDKLTLFFLVFCGLNLLIVIALIIYNTAAYFAHDDTVEFEGFNNASFKVHYLDSTSFGKAGPRPVEAHYLMSFTDFIEVENSFLLKLSETADIDYTYSATETFIISSQANGDATTNPLIHEDKVTLEEVSGSATTNELYFNGKNAAEDPGGLYTINPQRHINTYRRFVREHNAQMQRTSTASDRVYPFAANILLEFTYHIRSETGDISETLRRTVNIPLTKEVYNIEVNGNGTSMVELSIPIHTYEPPGTGASVFAVIWFVIHLLGVCLCIRSITYTARETMGKERYEVKRILRKYSDEIIILDKPMNLSAYENMPVNQFEDILKMAINLSKHIFCIEDGSGAKFCLVSEGYVYSYVLGYDGGDSKSGDNKGDNKSGDSGGAIPSELSGYLT